MRLLSLVLAGLLLLIQHPLWLGKGGILRVWDMERQIALQKQTNAKLHARNAALEADVLDLKQGLEAVEERARSELGMIRRDEVFFQVIEPSGRTPVPPSAQK